MNCRYRNHILFYCVRAQLDLTAGIFRYNSCAVAQSKDLKAFPKNSLQRPSGPKLNNLYLRKSSASNYLLLVAARAN